MNQVPLVLARIGLPSRVMNTCQGSTYPNTNQSSAPKKNSGMATAISPCCMSRTARTSVPATTVK